MRRIGLALALSLVVGVALLPRPAWAHHRHLRVHVGCCVFIAPVHPFVHHKFFVHHGFIRPHPFVHDGFVHPHVGSTVVVVNPPPVWVPGFWWWNGFQWLWVPGHWAQ